MTEARDDELRLGPAFEVALVYASMLHRAQTRKGGRVPYVSHLLGVASRRAEAAEACSEGGVHRAPRG